MSRPTQRAKIEITINIPQGQTLHDICVFLDKSFRYFHPSLCPAVIEKKSAEVEQPPQDEEML